MKTNLTTATPDWLTLSEASRFLGIHPITLRAWVDAGLVRAFRTPGRHRRFRRAELIEFMEQQRSIPETRTLIPAPDQTLQRMRREMDASSLQQAPWYAQLSGKQRAKHRELGQRLLGLLLQFVSRNDNTRHFLEDARTLTRRYGEDLAKAKLPSGEIARAFLFFREMVIQATYPPESFHPQVDADGVRLLQRINIFMDELLITTLDAYDQVSQSPTRSKPGSRLVRKRRV